MQHGNSYEKLDLKSMKWRQIIVLLVLIAGNLQDACAYNLRQISNKDNLSNSAVLSLCQDSEGFMWFGTCDGLNMFDGISIQLYSPREDSQYNLSGNLIEGITETEDGILWLETNYGLNKLNKRTQEIEYFYQFKGKFRFAKNHSNEAFVLNEDNKLYHYDRQEKNFFQLNFPKPMNQEVLRFFIDKNNVIWFFSTNKEVTRYKIEFESDSGKILPLTPLEDFVMKYKTAYVFWQNNNVFIVNEEGSLYEFDPENERLSFIKSIQKEILLYGEITDIIKDKDDYLVSFKTNGVIRLKYIPELEAKYVVEKIDISCGIFSLLKDEKQDIIWIATDGKGVYMYTRDSFSLKSILLSNLPFQIAKPLRAIFVDKNKNLWLGTKDDGILMLIDYVAERDIKSQKVERITTHNSLLNNNSVYSFSSSRRDLIWIGTDGPGLNYYSYLDGKIHKINHPDNNKIRYIHSIIEVEDSVLWASSVGLGIIKISLSGAGKQPQIKDIKSFSFGKGNMDSNYFFTAYRENDSIIWFGSRGYGAVRMNIETEKYQEIRFENESSPTINDIFSIHKDKTGKMWFGTSYGLVQILSYDPHSIQYKNFNEKDGFPNNTIHGILEDSRNNLWLSTNRGLVEFNSDKGSLRIHNYASAGLNVVEYSDGCFYKDESTGNFYFGGIDGFVIVREDVLYERKYSPPLKFENLKIYEKPVNMEDFIMTKKEEKILKIKSSQNFFSISFIALDYINGLNYTYQYKLVGFNDQWMDNASMNNVTFTNLPAGDYVLQVKYRNGISDSGSEIFSLRIKVLPPWYHTYWAYASYFFLLIGLMLCALMMVHKKQERRRIATLEKIKQDQKEEVYESKLSFFTNMTHELCAPLTLIYGPCNRILSHPGVDEFVRKYVSLIQYNAEKLNDLIQDIIEYRRIETGNKTNEILSVDISGLSRNITDSFSELAESRTVDYQVSIGGGIVWNTDKKSYSTILTNLISNAFKYTQDKGLVSVLIGKNNNELELCISNSGKGIKEEDIPLIFDRYRVLDNFEKQSGQGLSSRNGLGLSICHSLVKLLNGNISVHSTLGVITEFKVSLPEIEITETVSKGADIDFTVRNSSAKPMFLEPSQYSFDKSKPTILIADDEVEMIWFIADIFSGKYNVIPVSDSGSVIETIRQIQPSIIISDIMMPEMDGIALTKKIKSDKTISHIPIILLSARQLINDQIEGIQSGADAYITKPFNVDYLTTILEELLKRKEDLKDYYNSAISAFEFTDGKLIHNEDKLFFEKMVKLISDNVKKPDLSTDFIASSLGLSTRHLYRRLKNICSQTPSDIIKEHRLNIAENLLIKTNLTIDEIIYQSGFTNRATFFKLFSDKYNCTPKSYREKKVNEIG